MKKINSKKFSTLAIVSLVALSQIISIPSSNAASKGWRYWSYYQAAPGAKAWTVAETGPTSNVADGSVEGWVFTFSGDDVPNAAEPKTSPDFASICGRTKAVAGKKRVGVIIDFGSAILRPQGEVPPHGITKCVVIEKNAIGADILGKVTKVRAGSSGFICGLSGYPAKECGLEINTPKKFLK